MKKFVLTAALALALILAGTAGYALDSTPAAQAQSRLITRTAIIRLGSTVSLYTNTTHGSVGITSVDVVNCRVVMHFDLGQGEKILTAIAEEDETVSRLGIQAGITGGSSTAEIRMYKDGREVCATDGRFSSSANLWVTLTWLAPLAP